MIVREGERRKREAGIIDRKLREEAELGGMKKGEEEFQGEEEEVKRSRGRGRRGKKGGVINEEEKGREGRDQDRRGGGNGVNNGGRRKKGRKIKGRNKNKAD